MPNPLQSIFIVLYGKTGSGKSAVLNFLSSLKYPIIDLEKIAMHRGSAFGNAGIDEPQLSQKTFNDQLQQICATYHSKRFIFIEHKPASIGKRRIPNWFYTKMQEGLIAELHIPKNLRVQNIIKEYFDTEKKQQNILTALNKLSGRFSKEKISLLQELLLKKDYPTFVNEMLEYYDHSSNYQRFNKKPFIEIFVEGEYNIERISFQIVQLLSNRGILLNRFK